MRVGLAVCTLGALICAPFVMAAAPPPAAAPPCDKLVTIDELVAHPELHDGSVLWVVAYIEVAFENMTACPSRHERGPGHCAWLGSIANSETDDEAKLAALRRFHKRTVAIRATYDRDGPGHLRAWSGSLEHILEVSGHREAWSFETGTWVPRNACAGPLPEETAEEKVLAGNFDGAVADLSHEIARGQGDLFGAYLLRAYARRRGGDHAGAITDYTHLIDTTTPEQDRGIFYFLRATARLAAGDTEGARADCAQAIAREPNLVDSLRLSASRSQEPLGPETSAGVELLRSSCK